LRRGYSRSTRTDFHSRAKWSRAGKIKTLVSHATGTGDTVNYPLNGPKFLWIEPNNYVLIADTENHTVVRYDLANKTIERIAGTGKKSEGKPGGDPKQCPLNRPHGVAITSDNQVLISDTGNNRVLRIGISGD
jgi:hypothetical protein